MRNGRPLYKANTNKIHSINLHNKIITIHINIIDRCRAPAQSNYSSCPLISAYTRIYRGTHRCATEYRLI